MSEHIVRDASPKKVVMPIPAADEMAEDKTLVLALGNPLRGDDGIGVAILDHLAETPSLPANVTLCDGGCAGLESALLLQGYERAIIVDAAKLGSKPGVWRRLRFGQAMLRFADMHTIPSLHFAGLAEALTLGDVLGILPPEIVIYGVQPQNIGWSPGLSDPVRHAIPVICASILEELYRDHAACTGEKFSLPLA